jgi:predicted Fe-Mo cluster-binding NifX family protein
VIEMKIAVPSKGENGLRDRVADTFSRAPAFTIVTIQDDKIHDIKVIKNNASEMSQGAGPVAARTLKENGVNVLLSSDIGPGATNILETIGIAIGSASQNEKVKETVDRYLAQLEV